jgi:hypothetical protein
MNISSNEKNVADLSKSVSQQRMRSEIKIDLENFGAKKILATQRACGDAHTFLTGPAQAGQNFTEDSQSSL